MKRIIALTLLAAVGGCQGSSGDADANAANAAAEEAPATVRFVNSRQNALSDNLRRAYVDFAFDYPSAWAVTPPRTDGTERNFVRIAAPRVDGEEPAFVTIGSAVGSGDAEKDRRDIEQALPAIAQQFGAGLDDYRVASVGRDRVGPHDSWTWRFSGTRAGVDGGQPARISGRGDIVLPPGATRGVLIVSLVADRSAEANTPEQVGETGALKGIYDSFRLGPSAASDR